MQVIIGDRWRARSFTDAVWAMLQGVLLVGIQWLGTDALVANLPSAWIQHEWPGYVYHFALFFVATAIIIVLHPFIGDSFGLRWPHGRSYIWPAVLIASLGGVAMLIVDFIPDLLSHHQPATFGKGNVIPWLLMEGAIAGITEETVFRSLFLGYLINRLPMPVGFGRYKISVAGIITAFVFAGAHASSFWNTTLIDAISQQIYIVLWGLFYAYLFERSGSVIVPMIAHNTGNLVEYIGSLLLRAVWPT